MYLDLVFMDAILRELNSPPALAESDTTVSPAKVIALLLQQWQLLFELAAELCTFLETDFLPVAALSVTFFP